MAVPDVLKRHKARAGKRPRKILVVDVGGTHVKVLCSGHRKPRQIASGPSMSARAMRLGDNRNAFIGGFRLWDERPAHAYAATRVARGSERRATRATG